jgi:hypothetical protein
MDLIFFFLISTFNIKSVKNEASYFFFPWSHLNLMTKVASLVA